MKSREIELTFLAKRIPDEIKNTKPVRLIDVYVPEHSSFPVVRLRQRGNIYEITKKVPMREGDFSSHTEHTIPLEKDEFEALCRSSARAVIKDRYKIEINGQVAEVDIFLDRLSGLVMVDYEFEAEKQKEAFTIPDWCLTDVTQERFVLGGQLAGKGYKDIEADLRAFNYKPLSL